MLANLRLVNFRNYDDCVVSFVPGINVFIGKNGQGKTNILEALYYLSVLRSFRTSQMLHLKQFGKGFFLLNCRCLSSSGEELELQVSYDDEKRLMVNGANDVRPVDFITNFHCVAFLPSDLDIVKGSPALRRRFLDILLCKLSPAYLRQLQTFNSVLKCRNIMLKDGKKYPEATVKAYDFQLVKSGAAVEFSRLEIVEKLNEHLKTLSAEFFPDGRVLSLKYYPGINKLRQKVEDASYEQLCDIYSESLEKSYEYDYQQGSTKNGPHHGELGCLLDNKSLTYYGSQGECRTSMLALRFAELFCLEKQLDTDNILVLVDDVLGELDEVRRESFLQRIKLCNQVVFAGTEIPAGLIPEKEGIHYINAGIIS